MDSAEFSGRNDPLTERIIGVFYEVYNELGFGFLESVYRESMRIALGQAGLPVEAEVAVPVSFRGRLVGTFRADLVVDGRVVMN
jgi:GxxExxY protein